MHTAGEREVCGGAHARDTCHRRRDCRPVHDELDRGHAGLHLPDDRRRHHPPSEAAGPVSAADAVAHEENPGRDLTR
eukprot:1702179-Pyramimonas_sp.AAC.1